MKPDVQLAIFELKDMARLLREAPADPVVCGALKAALDRAAHIRLEPGMPLEDELRAAAAEVCFAAAHWWRGPGALLFGPDIAADEAKSLEIAGHLCTLRLAEVEPFCLTKTVSL